MLNTARLVGLLLRFVKMASPLSVADKAMDTPSDQKSLEIEAGRSDIDLAKQRKLVRKLDVHIIPMVMLLYLLSFLDR